MTISISDARLNGLRSFLELTDIEPGRFSGTDPKLLEIVFGDFQFHQSVWLKSEELSSQQRIAQVVFESRVSVNRSEWLVVWSMQYGINDAAAHVLHALHHLTISQTRQHIERLLHELETVQPQLQSVYRTTIAGRDDSIVSQDGESLTRGQLYIFGARQELTYALTLLQAVEDGAFTTQSTNRVAIPDGMAAFGVFADQQRHFAEKVLPHLRGIFQEGPRSIAVPYWHQKE